LVSKPRDFTRLFFGGEGFPSTMVAVERSVF
jgi:hypothetical protein